MDFSINVYIYTLLKYKYIGGKKSIKFTGKTREKKKL